MNRIALVTDSTTDLTQELQSEFSAHVVRLQVVFGDQAFFDGDLAPVEFYFKLLQSQQAPATPPPRTEDFIALYKSLLETHEQILSIHLSEAMSRTIAMARAARTALRAENRIHLVDSRSVSLGTALQVAEAARAIREGKEIQDIIADLKAVRDNTESLLMVDTLTFLRRGRRIGRLKGAVASFLNLKPIIRINEEGVFEPAGRVRDKDQALETMVELLREKAAGRKAVSLAVVHGSARESALRLQRTLQSAFAVQENFFTEVGPAVGVHVGPGVFGAALRFARD